MKRWRCESRIYGDFYFTSYHNEDVTKEEAERRHREQHRRRFADWGGLVEVTDLCDVAGSSPPSAAAS